MIPTRSMITRNSAIFQPHVTGASEAIAIPNPTMQSRTMVSFPPLMRASSCSRRSTLWRPCNGVSSSAIVALPLMRVLRAKAHPGASVPRAKTPRAPLRPREGIALRAWVPSMDSVDDPLPLDQPGFLYNLHSRQRRGSPRPARPGLTAPALSVITITGTLRRPVCLSSEFRDCGRSGPAFAGAPVTAEAANGHRQRQAGESGRGGDVHSGPPLPW
jgi:hypothetical protein